jgi:AraC family transcriptional regulator
MNPVDTALWYIETHFGDELTLESIAEHAGASPFYSTIWRRRASPSTQALLLAGLAERYTCDSSAGIPAQWQRFLPQLGHVAGQVGGAAYGVNFNGDDDGNFDYLCGVEVADFSRLPSSTGRLRVPEHRYAVFQHPEHIATIRRTHNTIWTVWLPGSGYEVADAPFFERYGEEFNGATGFGGMEIWLPIKKAGIPR